MMKRYYSFTNLTCLFIIHFILIWINPAHGATTPTQKANTHTSNQQILTKMSALQVPFIANEGQVDEEVRFYARTLGGTLYVTKKGEMVYSLPLVEAKQDNLTEQETPKQLERKGWVLKERLLGSLNPDIKSIEKANTKVNYFIGNDKSKWKSNVSSYNEVSLGEIYKGISLKLRAYGNNVEKIFTVNPGSRPEKIKLAVEGALSLATNNKGELEAETGLGTVRFRAPIAYQEKEGGRTYVKVAYKIDKDAYGFNVGDYDRQIPLIIDPLLASTFIGGSGDDQGRAVALDSSGNVYIVNITTSSDYPTTTGAYDVTYHGSDDISISKLNADLSSLIASTFIGGSGDEWSYDIALDSAGNVYVAGNTKSSNYPTTAGAYQQTYDGGWDSYISKLNSDLDTLLASTFIGGSVGNDDSAFALVLDISNSKVYVAGKNYLGGYPVTVGACYDATFNGSNDIVVSRLDFDLTALEASTYIGGTDQEIGLAIALDSSGNVVVFGVTLSSNYPFTGGVYDETHNGNWDFVVSKLDANLTTNIASTFIGGSGIDYAGRQIVLDSSDNVYITGHTESGDYPTTTGAYDTTHNGSRDVAVSILNANLTAPLIASTFIGGTGNDVGSGIDLDSSGNVCVVGYTSSSGYPTTSGAYDRTHNGSNDVFVTKLNSSLTTLQASTFIGGSGSDYSGGEAFILDGSDNFYIFGQTASTDFPTTSGAYDITHNGGTYDVFVSKLSNDLSLTQYYVDIANGTDDPAYGSSLGTGAWQTLHYAIQQINSGPPVNYLLNVAAGTYSYPDEIDDTLVINQDNVTIQGAGAGSTIIDGSSAAYWSTGIEINASNVTLKDLTVAEFSNDGITIQSGTGNVIDGCDVHDNRADGIYIGSSSSNNIVHNNAKIHNNYNSAGIRIDGSNGNEISGNQEIYDNGSGVPGRGIVVENGADNNLIHDNTIYWSGITDFHQEIGILITSAGSGNKIYQNEIYDHSDSGDVGIQIDSSSPEIRKNKIYNNSTGIHVYGDNGTASPSIVNNLIYNSSKGIEVWPVTSMGYASPSIYHNTIDGINESYGVYVYEDINYSTAEIKFNIITNFDYGIYYDGESPAITIDYNDLYGHYTGNYYGCTAGTNDISLDPSFVGGGDYNLQSGSPCIDAIPTGTPPGDPVSDDIVGNTRPQGSGYDMGCYEYLTPTQYTLTVTIVGQGSVTLNPTGGTYNEDTVVTLTAVADSGWYFSAWSGDLTGSTNPDTITMDTDKSVTATFTLNSPPDTPTTSSPADEATEASGDVTLQASPYSDADNDPHTQTHWRVRRADQITYFHDEISTSDLTVHTVSGLWEGMKYFWQVGYEDSEGNISWSAEFAFKVGTSMQDGDTVSPGKERKDFTMISFTQWPDNPSCDSVISVVYNPRNFRIGAYNPVIEDYIDYEGNLFIVPGRAYWILARNGLDFTYSGVPVSIELDLDVSIQNGWNQIGCPNAMNYYWGDVQVLDGTTVVGTLDSLAAEGDDQYIDIRIWKWTNDPSDPYESYEPGDSFLMQKYEGYWVKANKANISLRFRQIVQVASLSNQNTMFASILNKGKRWIKKWVFSPQAAVADSGDSPPLPMGDFSTVSPESVGGCFIAEAAYGSPMERHVRILRDFRDTYLLSSTIGHMFVKAYYRYSPPVADFIAKHKALKVAVQMGLLPLVAFCYSALHFGLAVSACGLLLIFMPLIFLVLVYQRKRV